jgi:hypothetical protein
MARHRASEPFESDVVITTPGLTADEIAAVTAVLTAALREQTANDEPVRHATESTWVRTRHPLRATLVRGPGAWRSFG